MKKDEYTHKFIRIEWLNEWSKKHNDKHITPVLSYSGRKYEDRNSYYYAIAIEWWCWAITIGFISINLKGGLLENNVKDFKKETGLINIFGKKLF